MTAVVVGAGGQLGRALCREFPDAVALDRAALDVSDEAAVRAFDFSAVDVVLNAPQGTAVDAVGYLARAVRTSGATAVVDDQVGRPTFAADLAAGINHLLETAAPFGTYNLTNAGEPVCWADLAAAVFETRGRRADDVRRVSTEEYFADKPGAAPRPRNSVLDLSKIIATGFQPRDWRPALREYLDSTA